MIKNLVETSIIKPHFSADSGYYLPENPISYTQSVSIHLEASLIHIFQNPNSFTVRAELGSNGVPLLP